MTTLLKRKSDQVTILFLWFTLKLGLLFIYLFSITVNIQYDFVLVSGV